MEMNTGYKIEDFYYPILRIMQDRRSLQRPSVIVQQVINRMHVADSVAPEWWNHGLRLQVKNKIRKAFAHLCIAELAQRTTNVLPQWLLTPKGEGFKDDNSTLIQQVRLALRSHKQELGSFGVSPEGQLISNKPRVVRRLSPRLPNIHNLNTLFYGAIATGKTREAIKLAVELAGKHLSKSEREQKQLHDFLGEQIEFLVLHKGIGYEQMVLHFSPHTQSWEEGFLLRLARRAEKEPNKSFVLLLEGIERTSIENLFGEMLLLFDPDKRIGQANPLKIALPSGEYVGLPANLYLVATIEDIRQAWQQMALYARYFELVELTPRYDLSSVAYSDFLWALNQELLRKKGEYFLIGHTFFLQSNQNFNFLRVLNRQIIPLLIAYFEGNQETVACLLQQAFQQAPSTHGRFEVTRHLQGSVQVSRIEHP